MTRVGHFRQVSRRYFHCPRNNLEWNPRDGVFAHCALVVVVAVGSTNLKVWQDTLGLSIWPPLVCLCLVLSGGTRAASSSTKRHLGRRNHLCDRIRCRCRRWLRRRMSSGKKASGYKTACWRRWSCCRARRTATQVTALPLVVWLIFSVRN